MENDEHYDVPLRHGRTDGINLLSMEKNKLFAIGYNSKYGLVDVCEDDGVPYFEGRVNIENLLSENQSEDPRFLNSKVEDHIRSSYNNYQDNRDNPEYSSPTPILEVLTYEGKAA